MCLTFRISRYGVTKTSLGITLCSAQTGGLPRYELVFSSVSHKTVGQVFSPDKEFRSRFPYKINKLTLLLPYLCMGGLFISDKLSMSP
jgi:hypothetical protein